MMTENDYIAQYIEEKRPELIHSLDFAFWKMAAMVRNFGNEINEAFKKAMSDEMVIEAAADPEFEDESYYEFLKQKGMEYCKKHRGSDDCLCGDCPLKDRLFCINEVGSLIINDDVREFIEAENEYKYMIKEVTRIDPDQYAAQQTD